MTQDDLLAWCQAHDCYIYQESIKDDGVYYLMRKSEDKNLMAMVFPVKRGVYRPASVCHVCNQLDIPVPDFGKPMQTIINEAKANCPKDWGDK